jgi:SAM-dependent methyltransferase
MRVIARFAGPNGEIAVVENLSTGARLYREGGINQSCVLAGGEAGLDYIRLMATLLVNADDALLVGCGGGALAGMLHRRGCSVTVVDVNPISFQLARLFFWMPNGIECITGDIRDVARRETRRFGSIGIDVGGPSFSYEKILDQVTIAHVRRILRRGGRIAVNISCDAIDDLVPGRIATLFKAEGLGVWMFCEKTTGTAEANAVILASARVEIYESLAACAPQNWSLAELAS